MAYRSNGNGNTFMYVFAAMALVLGWKFAKGSDGEGDTATITCSSENTNSGCKAIARQLREIFGRYYFYIPETATEEIANCFREIRDECGARKVYKAFGTLHSFTIADGGLDEWMKHTSDACKNACRSFTFGVETF